MRRGRVLIASALLFLARPASATPEVLFGEGPQSLGMGGTGAAHAVSFEAAYANPALASLLRARRVVLGGQGAGYALKAQGNVVPYSPYVGAALGLELPIPLQAALQDRVGLAMVVSTPTDVVGSAKARNPERSQFPLLADRTQVLALRLAAGVDVGYGVRVGAGIAAMASSDGNAVTSVDPAGRLSAKIDQQVVAKYSPIFGASYERPLFGADVRFALVYRTEISAPFLVTVDNRRVGTLSVPIFQIGGLQHYDPAELTLEAAARRSGWTAAVSLTWRRWSGFPGSVVATLPCPDGGTTCGALQPAVIPTSDTVVPRIGIERALSLGGGTGVRLRGGYAFDPTPVASSLPPGHAWNVDDQKTEDVPNRFFDASRHILTAGAGLALEDPAPLTFDVYAQAHLLQPRTVTFEGGPTGTQGTADVGGFIFAFGVFAGVAF
jgi:long-chain fatty acid transport protein